MTSLEFFRHLQGIGVQPDQALKLEGLAAQQAEQALSKQGGLSGGPEDMDEAISTARDRLWRAIEREKKQGHSLADTLDILLP